MDTTHALSAAKRLCIEGETEESHAGHKDELEAAYAAFAQQGDDSNPALPGVITPLAAAVVVTSVASR